MIRYILATLMMSLVGCGPRATSSLIEPLPDSSQRAVLHPVVDFEHWARIFPITTFERSSGPRRFDSTEKDDPLDLWKPQGDIITSPAHLCNIELVRKEYSQSKNLGRSVPVDIFLWSIAPPEKPYLTKLGGVPHRESSKPWPTDGGIPFTFVAQICFADSRDVVSSKIPNDVMLIFFKDAKSIYDHDTVHIEWSSTDLKSPMTVEQCPAPSFTVPQLSGHIYRTNEYPDSSEVFERAGHYEWYMFPTTQSTKIGRETRFIQNDPRWRGGGELICTLNSVHPTAYPPGAKWPFIGLESLPTDWNKPDDHYEWGKYRMMFGDVGCMYFLVDDSGKVTWTWDCY